jgi:tRNA (cmo5U34)-methyltransferase
MASSRFDAPSAEPASARPRRAWHDPDFVARYAERRQALLPLVELQEDVVRELVKAHDRPIASFLDLGAGAGAMTKLMLGCRPGSRAVLVDFSAPMLARARAGLAGGCRFVEADLSAPSWRARLPARRYDAVVSGLAIHHLRAERKRELFGELLATLEPGGIFVNMDYVATVGPLHRLFDRRMHANAVRAEHEGGGHRAGDEIHLDDGEDRPDGIEDQLRWLRGAGFEQVEVHFKWAEAAIFGGIRPPPGCDGRDDA